MISFKLLISLVFVLLMDTIKSWPKLCSDSSTPLESFTAVTQLVNDSYLVTNNYKSFSTFESQSFVNFSRKYSELEGNDRKTFGSHRFSFDIIFVIDINGNCVNVEEKLFVIDLSDRLGGNHKYTYYTNKTWSAVTNMEHKSTGLEALNVIDALASSNWLLFKNEFKLVLYFQSFGLLVINDGKDSKLAYCTNGGWKVQTNALKSKIEEINFHKIDAGFVDNDKKIVYFFESDSIGSKLEHIRKYFYNCSYILGTAEISLKCEKKSMDSLCDTKKETSPDTTKQTLSMTLMGLIVLVVIIAIVFQAIVCLLFCWPKKKEELSDTDKTLVAGKESHAVSHRESLESKQTLEIKKDQIKLNT